MTVCRLNVLWFLLLLFLACREDAKTDGDPSDTTVRFKNPVLSRAPDPWVEQHNGWYYFTHTTGHNLILYRTQKMGNLAIAEVKTIWSPPEEGPNSSEIWAPEIHFIQGKWYFYFAADDGNNENHRIWILENSSPDPFTGTWSETGELGLPDDKWAIDGTVFEHNGSNYFLWSGWEGDINVSQNIYIARMSDPRTIVGARVRLSKPELSWELHGGTPSVNEAPQFLAHGDRMFIVYSASGCWTDDYSLGLLSANISSNPMDPASWTKSPTPVFTSNMSSLAYGPGHNGFFRSPDGSEDWIIYHANEAPGLGCGDERSARMQKFGWKADVMPDFGIPVALGASLPVPSENQ